MPVREQHHELIVQERQVFSVIHARGSFVSKVRWSLKNFNAFCPDQRPPCPSLFVMQSAFRVVGSDIKFTRYAALHEQIILHHDINAFKETLLVIEGFPHQFPPVSYPKPFTRSLITCSFPAAVHSSTMNPLRFPEVVLSVVREG
jgi:hypothetical protein